MRVAVGSVGKATSIAPLASAGIMSGNASGTTSTSLTVSPGPQVLVERVLRNDVAGGDRDLEALHVLRALDLVGERLADDDRLVAVPRREAALVGDDPQLDTSVDGVVETRARGAAAGLYLVGAERR